ncbi:MAG: hypothetical protein GQ561_02915, partial [Calditrichae bacterium]|nr:hypothetical protein [Calditrichia bacterium]
MINKIYPYREKIAFIILLALLVIFKTVVQTRDFQRLNSGFSPSIIYGQQQDFMDFFPYEDNYTHDGIFVHEFISYAFHPTWQFEWERQFFQKSGFRISTGSLRTDELLVHGELTVNENLSKGWWFNTRGIWYSNLHRNHRDLSIYLGLEREIFKGVSLFALCFPRFNKEDLGVQLGMSWFGKQRQHYLSLALVLPEMVYDEKNEFGGKNNKKPLGLQWYAR